MASDNPNATVRLFVAISVPKPVRDELIRATQELRRLDERNRVRWTPPKQFHLTLKFPGEVAVARVEALN
jgi:2'-5' RNA ligase